ncbi:uncharacterized mitochondrial protein AtMg00810 [Lathyrus oleraceus]|uniref:uncharacterized mitochondrial protein AtMg00810 n=1 Tax=Pisum sativum TaxID=3888 RepID=UPI0021D132CA|nr:uncharacterized mitochondrial protein AtMg00810-like [Pisum sativum]
MQSEFDALIRNKTWDLVHCPCDSNLIRCMWIFRHKKNSDGSFERYKARLVGDGRSQVAVSRHPDGIFFNQSTYASEIIKRVGMASCKPSATPVDTNQKLNTSSGTSYEDPSLYQSLAGALQYLTLTRPNISYVVQQVCLHMHAPRTEHMPALKRILRYVQGTLHFGLHLSPSPNTTLISYTDTDWGGCPDTRHSTFGYCVFLGDNLISWSSKRQSTISRSNAEVEYKGLPMLSPNRVGFAIFSWNSIFLFLKPLWCIVIIMSFVKNEEGGRFGGLITLKTDIERLALHADPFWTTGNPVPYNSAVNKKYGTLKFQTSTEMDQEHNTLVASEFLSAPCRRKRYVE